MDKKQKDLLHKCKEDIIYSYIGNKIFKLKHTDYTQLADEIYNKTKISLSLSTLKRFFNEDYNSYPKISTLNAFANYLGFDNWKEYCKKNTTDKIIQTSSNYGIKKVSKGLIFISTGIALIIGIYFVINKVSSHSNTDLSNAEFYFNEYDSTQTPVTITFNYKLEGLKFDTANLHPLGFLGKGQDDITFLNPNDSTVTYTYLYPGCYHPMLVIDGKIIKQKRINIITNSWLAAVSQKRPFNIKYFNDEDIFKNGQLAFSPRIFEKAGFTLSDVEQTVYHLFKEFDNIVGDNLCFETSIKNKILGRSSESGMILIDLFFEDANIHIRFDDEKSSFKELGLGIIDNYYSSKKMDLSFLNRNFKDWNKIKLKALEKHFELHTDDSLVFHSDFTKAPGKLTGIRFVFEGLGEVDYVKFYNQNNELIYNNDFD